MKDLIEKGTVVDVRTIEEFSEGHFPGALNIPLDQVAQRIEEFKAMPSPIIAYCRSGNRSGIAKGILQQAGINEVVNAGGLDDLVQRSK